MSDIDKFWSIEEKKKLLMALQEHGPNDLLELQKHIPQKTITEIRLAFDHYTTLASEKTNKDDSLREEESAINQWIKVVKKATDSYTGVSDIVPRALKYVALFEKRPNDKEMNLRQCYLSLSYMSHLNIIKSLNPANNKFIFENLSKLALRIKKENNEKRIVFVRNLKPLDSTKREIKTYNRKKKKVNNTVLNPLNVPDDLLQDI